MYILVFLQGSGISLKLLKIIYKDKTHEKKLLVFYFIISRNVFYS